MSINKILMIAIQKRQLSFFSLADIFPLESFLSQVCSLPPSEQQDESHLMSKSYLMIFDAEAHLSVC